MAVTTGIVLDTRYTRENGQTFPVKLRVTYNRKQKYYSIEKFSDQHSDFLLQCYSVTKEDFEKAKSSSKPRGIHKERLLRYNAIEDRAREIINQLPLFTFELFEKNFLTTGRELDSVYTAYESYISRLKENGSLNTAISYECSLASIKSVMEKPKRLSFSEVTVDFLKEYQERMIKQGRSLTTISMYLRSLRSLFNEAVATGVIKQDIVPFGKWRFGVPSGIVTEKKALKLPDIQKLFTYKPENESEQWALDMWRFSYLCNGINLKDVANLKFKNIQEGRISFIRAKTKEKTRAPKSIKAIITKDVQEIMNRWAAKDSFSENYVFSILQHGLTPMHQLRKIQQAIKTINKYVNRIAMRLGIEKHVTTYSARHSFSTVLKRKGVPIEFISEALGHSSKKITEIYLDSFEDETYRGYSENLTNFDSIPDAPEPVKVVKIAG